MKQTIKTAAVVLVCTMSLASCKKDKENPIITISSPENHSDIMQGGTIEAKATFTDDKELAKYHVHIGDVDGEHVHDFHDAEFTGDLTDESFEFSQTISIPDSLSMDVYYLHFFVTDAEGKESTEKLMLHKHGGSHDH